ncbi:MAG: hypothetical protein ACRCZB_00100 [Bacteroidales bacterium]
MPRINAKEKALREKHYGKGYAKKHAGSYPDAIANGTAVEFKSAKIHNASLRILEGARKSDICSIQIHVANK